MVKFHFERSFGIFSFWSKVPWFLLYKRGFLTLWIEVGDDLSSPSTSSLSFFAFWFLLFSRYQSVSSPQYWHSQHLCINSNTTVSAKPIHPNSLLQHPYELKICMNSNKTDSARPIHLHSLLQHSVVLREELTDTIRFTRNICVSYMPLEPP